MRYIAVYESGEKILFCIFCLEILYLHLLMSNGTRTCIEADVGIFSMFGRTGAPTVRAPTGHNVCRTVA